MWSASKLDPERLREQTGMSRVLANISCASGMDYHTVLMRARELWHVLNIFELMIMAENGFSARARKRAKRIIKERISRLKDRAIGGDKLIKVRGVA